MDMKTPFRDDIDLERIREDIDEFFNSFNFTQDNIERLNLLLQEEDFIELDQNIISLNNLINLTLLLECENTNFIYDHNFIIAAKDFLFKKSANKSIINRDPISLKIMKELIYNYKKFVENDFIPAPKNNYNDENSIENIEKEIDKMYKDLRIDYKLPKNIFELDIIKFRSLLLINSFKEKQFHDYIDMYNILVSLDIGYTCLDEETLSEIKSIINTESFMNDYLLTVDDYSNENKINFLFFILTYVLNGTSDLEGFNFIIKTREVLSELLEGKSKKDLITNPNIPMGTKKRFKAIIDILLQNKEENKNDEIFDEDQSTASISNSYTYIKIKRIKEEPEENVKKKYHPPSILRENSDFSYENIELLKLIEIDKSLLIDPACPLEMSYVYNDFLKV